MYSCRPAWHCLGRRERSGVFLPSFLLVSSRLVIPSFPGSDPQSFKWETEEEAAEDRVNVEKSEDVVWEMGKGR